MSLNIDETIDTVKKINSRLSDLVDLPYTDFYKPERFVALFELPLKGHPKFSTISELIWNNDDEVFNRISFLEMLCNYLDFNFMCRINKLPYWDNHYEVVIKEIKKEFKGLGE
jgi:hypothetical protein